jgi:hypothetical protein
VRTSRLENPGATTGVRALIEFNGNFTEEMRAVDHMGKLPVWQTWESRLGLSTGPQIDEPINAAHQPATANDITDGHGDKAEEKCRPRQTTVVGSRKVTVTHNDDTQ